MADPKGDRSFQSGTQRMTDKSRPIQATSRSVSASDVFQRLPVAEPTNHPDPVPLANGHTDASNTVIDQVLPSGVPVRPVGSSVTTTSSPPRRNFDDIIKFLENELESRPRRLIACCIKQNDEPERTSADPPLEQRKEKRMNVEITLDPAAETSQWVRLPTGDQQTTNENALSLSLIVGGDSHRGVLGGVGPYCPADPDVLEFLRGAGFSPTQEIGVGKTVNVRFKFKKSARELDSREQALRVLCIIQDSNRRVVAYGSSISAYHIKAHPRSAKRPLTVPGTGPDIPAQGNAKRRRTNRDSIVGTSGTNGSTNDLSSRSSAGGSSADSVATITPSVPPVPPMPPMPSLPAQGPLLGHEHTHVNATSESGPTLTEAVPESCNWRGGISVSLLIDNLPPDEPIYARFGSKVVPTTRRKSVILVCKVPPANAPCEVKVTLSRGSLPSDPPYGSSLCIFVYEDDDVTKLVNSIKVSALDFDHFQTAEFIRQLGVLHGYAPPQPSFDAASVPCNGLLSIGWSEPARVELVHEDGENGPSEEVSGYMEAQEEVSGYMEDQEEVLGYMEAQEVVDLPTLEDQSDTHEDTPADSVLVLEENITRWLEAVPGDLAHLTPSPRALSSPPELADLSDIPQAAVHSPLPIYAPNHQSPVIVQPPEKYEELELLEKTFNACLWLLHDRLEPVIGEPACPAEAEKYGIRGRSCYTAFVEDNGDNTYGCRRERCLAIRFTSVDDAVRHQRYHHFDHRPFECIPLSGAQCGKRFHSEADLENHQQHCP